MVSVPKLPIHEHSNALFWKHKIGFAEQGVVSSLAFDSIFTEQLNKLQLGCAIRLSANVRHDLRSFFFSKNIGHS